MRQHHKHSTRNCFPFAPASGEHTLIFGWSSSKYSVLTPFSITACTFGTCMHGVRCSEINIIKSKRFTLSCESGIFFSVLSASTVTPTAAVAMFEDKGAHNTRLQAPLLTRIWRLCITMYHLTYHPVYHPVLLPCDWCSFENNHCDWFKIKRQ